MIKNKLWRVILLSFSILHATAMEYKENINFDNVFFNENKSVYTYAIIDNSRNRPKLQDEINRQIMNRYIQNRDNQNEINVSIEIPKDPLEEMIKKDGNYVTLWHKYFRDKVSLYPLYLVKLSKPSKILDYLNNHRDKDMVVYFQSTHELKELQEYYSSFTMPQIEKIKNKPKYGLFGFFDPFVFPSYVKTLYSKEKINEFFEPSLMWIIPLEFDISLYYIGTNNKIKNIILKKSNKEEHTLNIFYDKDKKLIMKDIRKVDYQQVDIFKETQLDIFIDKLITEYKEHTTYTFVHKYNNKLLKEKVYKYIKEGKKFKILSAGGLYRFVIIRFYYEEIGENKAFIKRLSLQEREQWKVLDNEIKRIKKENNE